MTDERDATAKIESAAEELASPPVNFERRYSQRGRKQGKGGNAEAIEMSSSNGVVGGKGPDRVKEAAGWSTWDRDGVVKIRYLEDKKAQGSVPTKPTSVPTWIKKCCGEFGNLPAYGVKGADGKWTLTSYKDYYKQIRTVSTYIALIKMSISPNSRIGSFFFVFSDARVPNSSICEIGS